MRGQPSIDTRSPVNGRGAASAPILRTELLSVRFGGLAALSEVNFEVAHGEIRLSPELAEYKLFAPGDIVCWPAGTGYAVAEWLRDLVRRCADLAENAQAFMGSLQRTIDLYELDDDAFRAYKDKLIEDLERFTREYNKSAADLFIRRPDEVAALRIGVHPAVGNRSAR